MISYIEWIVLILITSYLAFWYESVALMLLVFLEIIYIIFAHFYILYRKNNISANIYVPVRFSETGRENLVRIKITNSGVLSISGSKVLISVRNVISGEEKKTWMKLGKSHDVETVFDRNLVLEYAGNYEISLLKIKLYDLTGMFYQVMKLESKCKLQIMPRLHSIYVKIGLATRNFYGETEVYDDNKPGRDNSQIFQVREYQRGDRLQNVHWKITAKQDELMVKENSLPKCCPVILCLDYFIPKHGRNTKKAIKFMEIAASLSFSMMDAGCSHFVVVYDEKENDIVRIRVDDEEGVYFLMGVLLNVKWPNKKKNVAERYNEKYKSENYVWMLQLDEKLTLKKGEETLISLSEENVGEQLKELELVL